MKISITFTNLEHTSALDEHIHEKSRKLERFWNGVGEVLWTCYVNNGQHKAEVKWLGGKWQYQASAEGRDMYRSIHEAVNKLEKQLLKEKDKVKDKIHRQTTELVINDPENAWGDFEGHKQEAAAQVVDLNVYRQKKMSYEEKKLKKAQKLAVAGKTSKKEVKAKTVKKEAKKATATKTAKSKKMLRIPKAKKKAI